LKFESSKMETFPSKNSDSWKLKSQNLKSLNFETFVEISKIEIFNN